MPFEVTFVINARQYLNKLLAKVHSNKNEITSSNKTEEDCSDKKQEKNTKSSSETVSYVSRKKGAPKIQLQLTSEDRRSKSRDRGERVSIENEQLNLLDLEEDGTGARGDGKVVNKVNEVTSSYIKKIFSKKCKHANNDVIVKDGNNIHTEISQLSETTAIDTFSALLNPDQSLSTLVGKEFTLTTAVTVQAVENLESSEPNILLTGTIPFKVATKEGMKKRKVRVSGKISKPGDLSANSLVSSNEGSYACLDYGRGSITKVVGLQPQSSLHFPVNWKESKVFEPHDYIVQCGLTRKKKKGSDEALPEVPIEETEEVERKSAKSKKKVQTAEKGRKSEKKAGQPSVGGKSVTSGAGKSTTSGAGKSTTSGAGKSVASAASSRTGVGARSGISRKSGAKSKASKSGTTGTFSAAGAKSAKSGQMSTASPTRIESEESVESGESGKSAVSGKSLPLYEVPITSITVTRSRTRFISYTDGTEYIEKCGRETVTLKAPRGMYYIDGNVTSGEEEEEEMEAISQGSGYETIGTVKDTQSGVSKKTASSKSPSRRTPAMSDVQDSDLENAYTRDAYFFMRNANNSLFAYDIYGDEYNALKKAFTKNNTTGLPMEEKVLNQNISYPPVDYTEILEDRYNPLTWIYKSYNKTKNFVRGFSVCE